MQSDPNLPGLSEKGIYCLIFQNVACKLPIGRLGNISFLKGYYIYVGSALGPGGLKRMKRHVLLSEQKNKKARWHVDYLSMSCTFKLICVAYCRTDKSLECELAEKLAFSMPGGVSQGQIPGFGSSDCKCSSHLFFSSLFPVNNIQKAFHELGMDCDIVYHGYDFDDYNDFDDQDIMIL
ncbi:GIY-YIG nuclease family protein [Methanolobus sp. WCC5]|uniref:GIY-YIG nuclease family protein n=1 Tax=Methanolobus sp. WCC5 TaxID=3125785 RepID=UPI003255A3A2